MSTVSCVKVNKTSINPQIIFDAVKKSMELIHWEKYIAGKKILLKINVMWDKLYPSCTTTPMVIEGVIKTILSSKKCQNSEIAIVDTNTVSFMSADRAFKNEGIKTLAQKYNIKLINLSHTQFKTIALNKAYVLNKLKISRTLLEADTIITIPVPKTHAYSVMTGALKNQWGCIHELRHNYHLNLHPAIVDINKFLKNKVSLAVMDALFTMGGKGPKNGTPLKTGYILASHDLVSLDTAICQFMGINHNNVKYITLSQNIGLGTEKFKIVGNKLPILNLNLAKNLNFAMSMEMKLRKISPFFEKMIFDEKSPFLLSLRIAAKIYYDIWYKLFGIKNVNRMMATNFGKIWKKYYLN